MKDDDDIDDRIRCVVVIGLGMTGLPVGRRATDMFAQEMKLEKIGNENRVCFEDWRGNQLRHERLQSKQAGKSRLWKRQRR